MREIALERANNRCEWADCINYDQKLEMAHLVDIGRYVKRLSTWDWENRNYYDKSYTWSDDIYMSEDDLP